MNTCNLNPVAKRKVLAKVAEYLKEASEVKDFADSEDTYEALVKCFLDPLSSQDYFGSEGWERFFDV